MDKLIIRLNGLYLNKNHPKFSAKLFRIFQDDIPGWKSHINSHYYQGIIKENFLIEDNENYKLKIISPPSHTTKSIDEAITKNRENFQIFKVLQGKIFYSDLNYPNSTFKKNDIIWGESYSPIYRKYCMNKGKSLVLMLENKHKFISNVK